MQNCHMKADGQEIEELKKSLALEFKREFATGEAAEIAERLMAFVEAVHRASASSEGVPPFPEE
jgi:hypothetical protein